MAAIKEELGEKDAGEEDEMTTIENRLTAANLPTEVQKAADRELKRLRKMQPASSEYSVIRNYLDWLGDLPWTKSSEDILDVERARKQLNDDHHGLEKVKRRILEYLAVTKLQQMKGEVKGPIICLVGPPGVSQNISMFLVFPDGYSFIPIWPLFMVLDVNELIYRICLWIDDR